MFQEILVGWVALRIGDRKVGDFKKALSVFETGFPGQVIDGFAFVDDVVLTVFH